MHISAVKLIIITRHRHRQESAVFGVFVLTSFFSPAGCYCCFSVIDLKLMGTKPQWDISGNQRLRSI